MSNEEEKMYRWKGRIVKKKVYDALVKRTITGQNNKGRRIVQEEKKEPNSDNEILKGFRVVQLGFMVQQLQCKICDHKLFIENTEKETQRSLGSSFYVRCQKCLLLNPVKSSKEYVNPATGRKVFEVNTKATLGSWHGGMGQTNINKLFHTMDLPNFDSKLYKNHERIIGPVVEAVAKESCSEAVAMERVLTEENIEELKKLLPQHLQDGFLVVNVDSPTDTRSTVSTEGMI